MCSSCIIIIFAPLLLIPSIESKSELLLLDGHTLSLSIRTETQLSFSDINDLNTNLKWCLFYNRNDISNHLYCESTLFSPFITQCRSIHNERYTFTNVSLCDDHATLPHIERDLPSSLPLIGTFTDHYICHMYKHLCCELDTQECITNNGHINEMETTNKKALILPFTDGFLQFTLDTTLSIACISTNRNHPKCDQIPVASTLHTEANTLILLDALFISSDSVLILWTDAAYSTVFIHQCTIFTPNAECAHLSEIDLRISDGIHQEVSVIHHNECNLLLSVIVHYGNDDAYASYLLIYNYCTDEIRDKVAISHIANHDIYQILNGYIAYYRIPNVDHYSSEMTCFIVLAHSESKWMINCLSFALQSTSSTTTIAPSIAPTIDTHPRIHRNDISNNENASNTKAKVPANGFWPYSDASFITVIVVGGIVIISCLVCAVVCYSKYHKDKARKEWYKARELNKSKNRNKHTKSSKKSVSVLDIQDKRLRDRSVCSNIVHTVHKSDYYSESDLDSRYVYSASYPRRATKKRPFEFEMQPLPPPPPPACPPPLHHSMHTNRDRTTTITHRALPTYDEPEGNEIDADITPLTYTYGRANSVLSNASITVYGDYYDGETSVSSDTVEYNHQKATYILTRPSQRLPDHMTSVLSRCSLDEMDTEEEEEEKKYAAAPIPQYIAYTSALTKQVKFRKQPRITRRCSDDEEDWMSRRRTVYGYHNINRDLQSEDEDINCNNPIKYTLRDSSHSESMEPLKL